MLTFVKLRKQQRTSSEGTSSQFLPTGDGVLPKEVTTFIEPDLLRAKKLTLRQNTHSFEDDELLLHLRPLRRILLCADGRLRVGVVVQDVLL